MDDIGGKGRGDVYDIIIHVHCTIIIGSSSSGQSTDNLHTMITRTLNNHPDIMGENFMCMNILMR